MERRIESPTRAESLMYMQVDKPTRATTFPSRHHETHRLVGKLQNNKWQQPLWIFQSHQDLPVSIAQKDKEQAQNGKSVMMKGSKSVIF